jgi:hypothetical protein
MNKRLGVILTIGVVLCLAVFVLGRRHTAVAQATANPTKPERKVTGNVLESERDPKVRLEIKPPIVYVGADRWVLYNVADCEIQVFVEADQNKKVKRLYWVQFEGFLPELTYTYDYEDSASRATIGGKPFYVDSWVSRTDTKPERPGSDTEHVRELIKAKGYTLPAEMMSQRLVHLLDEKKRRELMIIYSEDLAPTGYSVPDLRKDGKAHDQWPAIDQALLKRGLAGMELKFSF